MELLKLILTLLSGGACGALINEWLFRRKARVQPIPLVERVNRVVSSELHGFVLARVPVGSESGDLEVIQRVREYQFTLRNSSYIHLHNAEVQFEFPSEDVEARAERPVRSKTTPVPVDAEISKPWKRGFRWRIPEFPPGDSMEFTFRAVNSPSSEYEVALYGGGQVVIEKSKGEPIAHGSIFMRSVLLGVKSGFFVSVAALVFEGIWIFARPSGEKVTHIDREGCSLNITTGSIQVNPSILFWRGPWKIYVNILNTGHRKCFVQSDGFGVGGSIPTEPDQDVPALGEYTETWPQKKSKEILFGPDGPTNKATVILYDKEPQ